MSASVEMMVCLFLGAVCLLVFFYMRSKERRNHSEYRIGCVMVGLICLLLIGHAVHLIIQQVERIDLPVQTGIVHSQTESVG